MKVAPAISIYEAYSSQSDPPTAVSKVLSPPQILIVDDGAATMELEFNEALHG
jgi:hypothetical protein